MLENIPLRHAQNIEHAESIDCDNEAQIGEQNAQREQARHDRQPLYEKHVDEHVQEAEPRQHEHSD
ncbi:hypothetical protein D9M71_824630 [compost metagenome]